jgi:hypothetical protein
MKYEIDLTKKEIKLLEPCTIGEIKEIFGHIGDYKILPFEEKISYIPYYQKYPQNPIYPQILPIITY